MTELQQEFYDLANLERAKSSKKFFKTGEGEYGERDRFLGISVPEQRKVIKKYKHLTLHEIQELLYSEFHEFRLSALFILAEQFRKASEEKRQEIYLFYLENIAQINNWDLVDSSAKEIVGAFLFDKDRSKLYELAESKHLWSQRIAIIATFYFLMRGQFEDTLKIAVILLHHPHDLIQKGVGWMLKESWKRGAKNEIEAFLEKYASEMPRTTLRYAIEKMDEPKRKYFLNR